jgi:hypothetical protein
LLAGEPCLRKNGESRRGVGILDGSAATQTRNSHAGAAGLAAAQSQRATAKRYAVQEEATVFGHAAVGADRPLDWGRRVTGEQVSEQSEQFVFFDGAAGQAEVYRHDFAKGAWREAVVDSAEVAVNCGEAGAPSSLIVVGHGRDAAAHGAGPQRHQEPGALPDFPQAFLVAAAGHTAFDQRHIEGRFAVAGRRGHEEIANVYESSQGEQLVLAIQQDELVAGAAGEAENSHTRPGHQIISGRLMASQ